MRAVCVICEYGGPYVLYFSPWVFCPQYKKKKEKERVVPSTEIAKSPFPNTLSAPCDGQRTYCPGGHRFVHDSPFIHTVCDAYIVSLHFVLFFPSGFARQYNLSSEKKNRHPLSQTAEAHTPTGNSLADPLAIDCCYS